LDLSTPSGDAVVWQDARFDHRTPVPVTKEQLLSASRSYREYNQICKDSGANLKYWSLFNDMFWDDAEHKRVNNCWQAGTLITLANGECVPIEKIKPGQTVFSFSREDNGLVPRKVTAVLDQGEKECIELRLLDGRTLVCTAEHRILNDSGQWIPAEKLQPGTAAVSVGVTYPSTEITGDELPLTWRCEATEASLGYALDLRANRARSLAFVRLLGYLLTDGTIRQYDSNKTTTLFFGHPFDVRMAQDDIELLLGVRINNKLVRNVFTMTVPKRLSDAFEAVGASTADRRTTVCHFPQFITDASCPLVIVQQFLAGLFGGDGRTVSVGHQVSHKTFTPLGFSKSIRGEKAAEQLGVLRSDLGTLLARVGIATTANDWRVVQGVTSITAKGRAIVARRKSQGLTLSQTRSDASSVNPEMSASLQLNLATTETVPFADRVGFAYCCHKQIRLTAAATVMHARAFLCRQRRAVLDAIEARKENGAQTIREAFEASRRKLEESEQLHPLVANWQVKTRQKMSAGHQIPENSIASLLTTMQADGFFSQRRQKRKYVSNSASKKARRTDESQTPDAAAPEDEWTAANDFHNIGNDSEAGDSEAATITYGVHRDATSMPMFRVPVIGVRAVGVRHVYDLSVPTERGVAADEDEASFVANGVVAHNCLAYALNSRDSIYHRTHKPQPGDINGCPGVCAPLTQSDYVNRPDKIVHRLRRDFNSAPHELIFPEEEDFEAFKFPLEYKKEHWDRHVPPPGYYAACLLIATQNDMYDYHFARQDSNGFWSHKPGSNMVENVDASGNLITDPERADWFYDPQNQGVGYNYTFYRWIFVLAKAPSRAAIMEENYEHANKRFSLRPDLFYNPHHPTRSNEAAGVAKEAATAVNEDRQRRKAEKVKTIQAASAVAGSGRKH
jgi:hypothetical protein